MYLVSEPGGNTRIEAGREPRTRAQPWSSPAEMRAQVRASRQSQAEGNSPRPPLARLRTDTARGRTNLANTDKTGWSAVSVAREVLRDNSHPRQGSTLTHGSLTQLPAFRRIPAAADKPTYTNCRPGPPQARSYRAPAESAGICLNYLTGDTMTEHSDLLTDAGPEDLFEKEMRGYSRRRVDEFVARNRSQIRDLEERLSRELDNVERLRLELTSARQASEDKPAHEEISERVGQILKLADDEAKAQRDRANEEMAKLRNQAKLETDKLRADAKQDTDKVRAEAHEQAERMLSAAQEQAEHSIATARAEAEKTRSASRAEAERAVADANKHAESSVAAAKAQAKQQLDE